MKWSVSDSYVSQDTAKFNCSWWTSL